MEIRSLVVLRSANEIEFVKKNVRAISPVEYHRRICAIGEPKGMKFIGFVGVWCGKSTRVLMRCKQGHYFELSLQAIMIGRGCVYCSGLKKKTPGQVKDEATKLLENFGRGETFVSIDGEYKGIHARNLNVNCSMHGNYKTSLINIRKGHSCPECKRLKVNANNRMPETDALSQVSMLANERGDCEVVGFENGYVNASTRNLVMRCFEHGEYKTSRNGFCRGSGCPSCSKHGYSTTRPGYIYVQKLTGLVDAIKCGVTNISALERMEQQSRKSKLNHELVFSWYFDDGEKALAIEREIKKKYKEFTGFVSREYMPDGFTETLPGDMLNTFLKNVKSLCNLYQ